MSGYVEWYRKYRPTCWDDVVGQKGAVQAARGFGDKIPHAILASGPSGSGKTTALRILAGQVGCPADGPDHSRLDYHEINCAAIESPLELVRELQNTRNSYPAAARSRVWILDELQAWSRSRGAQEGLLKILEDTPRDAYYFLGTTDPQKIIQPIHTRCTQLKFKDVSAADLKTALRRVAKLEGIEFESAVIDEVARCASGSPRAAIVELQRLAGIPPAERMAAVGKGCVDETGAFALVKVLLPFKGEPRWTDVGGVLQALYDDEHDPEGLRCMVLAAARARLVKAGPDAGLCARVIVSLADPIYDRTLGHALLAARCWRAVHSK